jgi:hypothetical protein
LYKPPEVGVTMPPAGGLAAMVSTNWVAAHVPDMQTRPEPQTVPSGAVGLEQVPLEGLQLPAIWHASSGVQVTGFDPVHVPAWQTSVSVQALPSLQDVPLGNAGFEQVPVAELQVPAAWHWSRAVQMTRFDPMHVPDWQVSVCVHALPSLQVVPSAWLDQVVVELAGVQTSQAFVGFTVPAG